jgi:hypothetical protein
MNEGNAQKFDVNFTYILMEVNDWYPFIIYMPLSKLLFYSF